MDSRARGIGGERGEEGGRGGGDHAGELGHAGDLDHAGDFLRIDPKARLDRISDSLGFSEAFGGEEKALFDPRDERDLEGAFELFGVHSFDPPTKRKVVGGRRAGKKQHPGTKQTKSHPLTSSDTAETHGLALADAVISSVKAKYSVSAIRSMYRRRKEADVAGQRAAYARSRVDMLPDERTREWKEARVERARGRKTGTIEELGRDLEKEKAGEEEEEEEEPGHVIKGITLQRLSTDPFYKSNLEQDVRKLLRSSKPVLLIASCLENGGSGPDAKLALQMAATALLRDIDGGIIPRAKERVNEGVPTGDWEMELLPKGERGEKASKVEFEFRLPRHNFDEGGREKRLTTAPC